MKFPSLIKLPQNRRFELKTRYYDERKEALQQRVSKQAGADAVQHVKDRLRASFRDRRTRKRGNDGRTSHIRLALIVLILSVLTFLIFY